MAGLLVFFIVLLLASPGFALRIVSLLPSNTEIVEALGAGGDLVGVTTFDSFPAGSQRADVGDFLNPQWEILLSLKPDLVLAGKWSSSPAVSRLRSLHIAVVEIDHASTLSDLYASIREIAHAIHRPPEQAEKIIKDMQNRLAVLKTRTASLPVHRLYIEIDPPNWTLGGKDVLNDGLKMLRLENVFGTLPRRSSQVSAESVIERNPDVILVFHAKASDIRRRAGWSKVSAVQKGWILDDVRADDLVRPSPRLVEGLERLSARLERLPNAH